MWDGFSHSTDSPLDMTLQLSLRCLKKKFTSHHLRPEIPVSQGGTGGQNEHLPCEYVIAPDKKFDFTLHLSSSAYLHIHAFLQQQDSVLQSVIATRKVIHWKRPEGTVCPPQLSFSRTSTFQCAQDFACQGRGSFAAEIPSSGTAFSCCRAALHKKELNRTNRHPSDKKTLNIKIFLAWT